MDSVAQWTEASRAASVFRNEDPLPVTGGMLQMFGCNVGSGELSWVA